MNAIELLKFIFDGVEGAFAVFTAADEVHVTLETLDSAYPENATIAELMTVDGDVYAVPVPSASGATFKATSPNGETFYAVLSTPVAEPDVPECVPSFDLPVDASVSFEMLNSETLSTAEDAMALYAPPPPETETTDAQADLEDEAMAGPDGPETDCSGAGNAPASDLDQAEEPERTDEASETAGDTAAPHGDGAGVAAPKHFLDAELLGDAEASGIDELLAQPMTFLTGELWGAHDRRNTRDEAWKATSVPLTAWLQGYAGDKNAPAWGLARHPESVHKEGACIVLGSSIGGARKAKAMDEMYAMGLDIDAGYPLDAMLDKVEKLGLFCVVYTTHSHGKQGLQLKHEEVLRKLQIDPKDLNLAQVQRYLRDFDKNRYEESFINQVTVKALKKQVKSGVVIDLGTPPLDKYRLIFPLAKAVKLIDLGATQSEALEVWEDKITGLARETLEVHFDTSCTDPSRLFFLPRHPKGNNDWYSAVVMGKPLRFEDVPTVKKASYTKNRKPLNAYEVAGGALEDTGNRAPPCITPSGASLNDWHYRAKDRFNMADLVEDHCPDKIRVAGGEAQGHVHIECPFEHEHSSEGGTATMVVNALDSQNGYWTWFCQHDSCQGRHKLEFLQEALAQNWFSEDELFGESVYMMEGADEDDEEEDTPEEEAPIETGPKSFTDQAAEFAGTAEELGLFIAKAFKMGVDVIERAQITKALQKSTALPKREIDKIWKELDREQAERDRKRAQKSEKVEKTQSVALVNEWGFHDMCGFAHRQIHDSNHEKPSVFHYMEGLCVVREDSKGHAHIKFLDKDGFAHHLNTVAAFGRIAGEDKKDIRGVSAPDDVVRHLFSADYGTYPDLRGVVSTPIFTSNGKLLTTPGYDWDSHLYYQPDMSLSLPAISAAPDEEEIMKAKTLLIEEVFADFPLGGLTRPEIMEQALHGDGVPAVTNLMGLVLLPFMRELVDGPTPGHLLVKPAPGTGASLLTDVFSIIASGRETPALAMPSSKDEMSKTLTSVLANGQNIVFFDNVNHSVDSGELASAMTAPTYQARILGKTQTVEVAVRCAWLLTGNNVTLSDELVRRLVMIDLDARVAHPELRKDFRHEDIRIWARANRGELVWACLTLIQNWVAKGMQHQKDVTLASYESWSGAVGGVLAAADLGGFMKNREQLKAKASDDGGDAIAFMLEAWWKQFGSQPAYLKGDKEGGSLGSAIGLIELAVEEEIPVGARRERNSDGDMSFQMGSFSQWLHTYKDRVFELEDGTEVRVERGDERSARGYLWNLTILNRRVQGNVKV